MSDTQVGKTQTAPVIWLHKCNKNGKGKVKLLPELMTLTDLVTNYKQNDL